MISDKSVMVKGNRVKRTRGKALTGNKNRHQWIRIQAAIGEKSCSKWILVRLTEKEALLKKSRLIPAI